MNLRRRSSTLQVSVAHTSSRGPQQSQQLWSPRLPELAGEATDAGDMTSKDLRRVEELVCICLATRNLYTALSILTNARIQIASPGTDGHELMASVGR